MIIADAIPDDAPDLDPDVLVLQGWPGSGKSTWWREYFQSAIVLSTDTFFLDEKKRYRFDYSKLGEAHTWCLREFVKALQNPDYKGRTIIVDNNNLSVAEVSPYMNLPSCYNRHALLLTFHCAIETCIRRQQHGVPIPQIMKKKRIFDAESNRMPLYWQREYIFSGGDGMEEASWTPSREQL